MATRNWRSPARPRTPDDHATHIDVESLDATAAQRIAELVADAGVRIVAVSCYDNLLDPEPGDAVREHLIACCDAARRLGTHLVGMFVGASAADRA